MDIQNYEKACQYAQSHKYVHQYTTFDALKSIIENRALRLSRIDKLNDAIENSRLLGLWREKVYVSCFTHCDHESYFFWETYAKGSPEGVMISLKPTRLNSLYLYPDKKCEKTPLSECIKTDFNAVFSPELSAESWGIYDYSCVDVAYISRKAHIGEGESLLGRIKYHEWDMEQETRLRVAVRPKCFEVTSEGLNFKYLTPQSKYIYAKLSDSCLSSMIITLSPFANQTLREKVAQLLKDNDLIGIRVQNSILTGEIQNEAKESG